jgi:hypothetical protein
LQNEFSFVLKSYTRDILNQILIKLQEKGYGDKLTDKLNVTKKQINKIEIIIMSYLTRFIQLFLPLKKLSLKGISMGAQIADEVLVLLLLEQQSTSLPLLLTTGVWVRSWSMYCPKAISIVVTLLSGVLSLMRVHCVDT